MSTPYSFLFVLIALTVNSSIWAATQDDFRQALKNGDYSSAATIGKGLLQNHPENPEIRFLTALALQKNNQIDAAEQYYLKLTEDHPELPEPHNNLALIYLQKGDHDKSASQLISALKTHPAYATAWQNLSDLYKGLASEAYRKALGEETKESTALAQIQLNELDQLHLKVEQIIIPVTVPVYTLEDQPEDNLVLSTAPVQQNPVNSTQTQSDPAAGNNSEAAQSTETNRDTLQSVVDDQELNKPDRVSLQAEASAQGIEQTPADALYEWAKAWSDQNIDAYIDTYVDNYRGSLKSREAWIKQRQVRLSKPEFISIEVGNLELKKQSEQQAIVDFEQSFKSDSYQDKVVKRIDMTKINGDWKIQRERTLKVLQKNR